MNIIKYCVNAEKSALFVLSILFSCIVVYCMILLSIVAFQLIVILSMIFIISIFFWFSMILIVAFSVAVLHYIVLPLKEKHATASIPARQAVVPIDDPEHDALQLVFSHADEVASDIVIADDQSQISRFDMRKKQVESLREAGRNKKQIIEEVWGVKPGGGKTYRHASDEYEKMILP